jgi:hypothetical protein
MASATLTEHDAGAAEMVHRVPTGVERNALSADLAQPLVTSFRVH